MLSKLNMCLASAAENIAELESLLGKYLKSDNCFCTVQEQQVFLEYQHDLDFEEASEQAETLLRLFELPFGAVSDGKPRNLLVGMSGKGDTVKLHLDLTYVDEDDLLVQYICSQLLDIFQKLESKL